MPHKGFANTCMQLLKNRHLRQSSNTHGFHLPRSTIGISFGFKITWVTSMPVELPIGNHLSVGPQGAFSLSVPLGMGLLQWCSWWTTYSTQPAEDVQV